MSDNKINGFTRVRRNIGPIHVSLNGEVTHLNPESIDEQFMQPFIDENMFIGNGSINSPFQYIDIVPISHHYSIVNLWYYCCYIIVNGPSYIKVNDWVLLCTSYGVISQDKTPTPFLK